jgi:hypothetical protein
VGVSGFAHLPTDLLLIVYALLYTLLVSVSSLPRPQLRSSVLESGQCRANQTVLCRVFRTVRSSPENLERGPERASDFSAQENSHAHRSRCWIASLP